MNNSIFSKTRFVRIIAASLMLSVYICTVLVNYASREITSGNFIATVIFLISIALFFSFSSEKKHPPLLWAVRGWLVLSVFFCFLAAVFTAAEAEITGFFGDLIGCGIMLFVSPYFGLFFFKPDRNCFNHFSLFSFSSPKATFNRKESIARGLFKVNKNR